MISPSRFYKTWAILAAFFLSAGLPKIALAEETQSTNSSAIPAPSIKPIHVEIAGLSLFVGSIFTTVNFGLSKQFTIGPSLGFHPLYLFIPGNSTVAYDIGIDSNIYVFGDRYSHSWFVNPYLYYSGYHSYRAEQPSVHGGFNIGYRWVFPSQMIVSVGGGIQSIYSYLHTYSYSPGGRVSEDQVSTFVPVSPSIRCTIGFAL